MRFATKTKELISTSPLHMPRYPDAPPVMRALRRGEYVAAIILLAARANGESHTISITNKYVFGDSIQTRGSYGFLPTVADMET